MPDGDFPGGVLKPKIENDMRRDAVDSRTDSAKLGEPLKKACATRPSLRPFHSARSVSPNQWSKALSSPIAYHRGRIVPDIQIQLLVVLRRVR